MDERARTWRMKTAVAVLVGLVFSALVVAVTGAATTVSPTQAGNPPFTRDTAVNLTVNPVAVTFQRTGSGTASATSNFARVAPAHIPSFGIVNPCIGDDAAGTNNSPRTVVEVIGPGTTGVVHTATSPVLRNDLTGASNGYPVLSPQPAPNSTNYRGGAHGNSVSGAPSSGNNTRPWTTTANLDGKPGGVYTVKTTTYNKIRTGPSTNRGPCVDGSAVFNNGAWTNQFTTGPTVETTTFEYRPWQEVFTDVLDNGNVQANVVPKEFQPTIRATVGRIVQGGRANQQFFALPGEDTFALPTDPAGCAADPNSCLPAAASPCDPSAGCVPRIMIINSKVAKTSTAPGQEVLGVFDLDTQAFIAYVRIGQKQQTMFSLGTELDAQYKDLLQQLSDAAAEQGIDLLTLLSTKVRVRTGADEVSLSLLNGLQWDASTEPAGVQIVTGPSAQAGIILNIYAGLTAACKTQAGDSNPATAAPDRFTMSSDAGYTVQKSDLIPEVPRVGPLGALVGGPIYHIEGDFVTSGSTLLNTSSAVVGIDAAADEPNGYPIWIQPFVSTPAHVTVPKTMDFLGTATWSASETNLGPIGCLSINFMLGAGVAIFDNPLPIGFGDIPVWDPQSAEVQALMAQVNGAVQEVVDTAASDPTVNGVLEDILAALPL